MSGINGAAPIDFAQPDDLAESIYQISQQSRPAWSFYTELLPFNEPCRRYFEPPSIFKMAPVV